MKTNNTTTENNSYEEWLEMAKASKCSPVKPRSEKEIELERKCDKISKRYM